MVDLFENPVVKRKKDDLSRHGRLGQPGCQGALRTITIFVFCGVTRPRPRRTM